ncbi:hypothetical protein PanWU01x14_027230 [Parasponia andersonii]|uniref:Uncharacterized protein n=1 Tax=Parasponia andersonii TaxID=3476 RepID=A0A2P5DW84_PARAD|nr:hypothetical protein PanWU01x14_027230 [Parasponia andersonii]
MFGKVGSYGGDTTRRLCATNIVTQQIYSQFDSMRRPNFEPKRKFKTWEKESERVTEYSNKSYIIIYEVSVLGNSSCELLLQFNSYNVIIFINIIFMY